MRVATNVQKDDGSRAIGTVPDPKGKAYAATRGGTAYYGDANILGKPYVTGYEPIRDGQGEVIGVYYASATSRASESDAPVLRRRSVAEGPSATLRDTHRALLAARRRPPALSRHAAPRARPRAGRSPRRAACRCGGPSVPVAHTALVPGAAAGMGRSGRTWTTWFAGDTEERRLGSSMIGPVSVRIGSRASVGS